jgi:hypothetical protein
MLRLVLIGALGIAAVQMAAQSFQAPERIMGAGKPVGHVLEDRPRPYPSPGMHDITGDGRMELVIGDLRGRLTYVVRTEDGWSEERVLIATDGNPLSFVNW